MFTHEPMTSVDDDIDFDRLAMGCMHFMRTTDAYPWLSADFTDEERLAQLRADVKQNETDPKTPPAFGWKTFVDGYAVACCYGVRADETFYSRIALFGADMSGSRRWLWDRSQQAPLTVMLEANGIKIFNVQTYAANTSLNNYLINGKGIADSVYGEGTSDKNPNRITFNIR